MKFRKQAWHRRNWLVATPRWQLWCAVLLAMVVGWFFLDARLANRNLGEAQESAEFELEHLIMSLESEIAASTMVTLGIATAVEVSPELVDENFDELASRLAASRKNIVSVALAPDMIVSHVYPSTGEQSALGFDLRTMDERYGTYGVHEAIASKSTVLVGPIVRPNGREGLVVRTPVFKPDNVTGGVKLWGIVGVVIDAEGLFKSVGFSKLKENFHIAIQQIETDRSPDHMIHGSFDAMDERAVSRNAVLPGAVWQISLQSKAFGGLRGDYLSSLTSYMAICAFVALWLRHTLNQAALRQRAEDLLFDAIDAIDDGFVIYDAKDRFVACNQAYRDFYNKSADLFVPGKSFQEIVSQGAWRGQYPDAVGREEDWIAERMEAHRNCRSNIVQRLSDGRFLKISERKTVGGGTVGFRVDVTELNEARETAERAYQAKSEFISVLSHELRTPLTIILGYAKVLANLNKFQDMMKFDSLINEDKLDREKIRASVNALVSKTCDQATKMEKSGSHLLVLINDLLDYSKIEAGHFQLAKQDLHLKTLVASVVEDMSDFAHSRSVQLVDQSSDVVLEADPIRLKQVLINLINNAIKFTDNGEVRVETSVQNDCVLLSVVDTGSGIEREKLQAIFEAFQQADFSDKRNVGGTGLGLAISRRIVELHGGTLTVESVFGEGSCFTARLPREVMPQKPRTMTARLLSRTAA